MILALAMLLGMCSFASAEAGKGTIMWLSNLSSGIQYETTRDYLTLLCGELGYDFTIVYGDGYNDPAGNLTDCITHSKPDPEVFLKAAEFIGLKPSECLVVEDAHAGVQAAKAGGFDCAAMGDAKDDERADHHLNSFSDLLQAVRA